jgi:hypothetical protein
MNEGSSINEVATYLGLNPSRAHEVHHIPDVLFYRRLGGVKYSDPSCAIVLPAP